MLFCQDRFDIINTGNYRKKESPFTPAAVTAGKKRGALNSLRGECPLLEDPQYLDEGILVKTLLDEKNYPKFSAFILRQD